MDAVLGIDVGTGSARAGLFSTDGRMLAQASHPIRTWRPRPGYVQQSTTDIWDAVCRAVRETAAAAGTVTVRGIGFDATCSLALIDEAGRPVPIDPPAAADGDAPVQDVIVWMDHRAGHEADAINAGRYDVLRYVGGRISLEMETPKLAWLREHRPGAWDRTAHFFDLPDYLTWRATGSTVRSACSTVCKWTYLGHEGRWDEEYFRGIGLGALADEGFRRIGTEIRPLGTPVGPLSDEAAAAFGLPPGIPVGVSAIDAHAGGIGTIGAARRDGDVPDDGALLRRLALIGGTSSCHMAVSPDPRFVPGVWGPYFGAMVPGLWLNEGGQSATGSLIDHVITTHAAHAGLAEQARRDGRSLYQLLNDRLKRLAQDLPFLAMLTRDLHVMPDFHGNRSPRADPSLRGMISGLRLGADADDLALLYLATIQGIAYGTRHIIETLNARGYAIDTVMASGGGTRNPVFLREHADATGCAVVLARESEPVLLGASILGAVAGGLYPDIRAAMTAMSHEGVVVEPVEDGARRYHDTKYAVFRRMFEDQTAYRMLMA